MSFATRLNGHLHHCLADAVRDEREGSGNKEPKDGGESNDRHHQTAHADAVDIEVDILLTPLRNATHPKDGLDQQED